MRVVVLMALALVACNECRFWEQCDGDTLLVCGQGPDQIVGREVEEHPCESPNSVCKEREEHAWCVQDAEQPCDPATYVSTCDDDLLLTCPSDAQWVIATDCASAYGSTCAQTEEGAACQ